MVYDVIVIGAGQSGLTVGYYLRRAKLDYLILDGQEKAGGAWLHTWDSLQLFSPANHSSISGWLMPKTEGAYPSRQEAIDYLTKYEQRYKLPVNRPVQVLNVTQDNGVFELETTQGQFQTKALVSATGTWQKPYVPSYKDQELFEGEQLHSAHYKNEQPFVNKNVMIVGGGNSAAQILAEVSQVAAQTTWITLEDPEFLPDDVDGRYLFEYYTKLYQAQKEGRDLPKVSLANIVMVDSVKEARELNVLHALPPFDGFDEDGVYWENGSHIDLDAVIWCTGFKPALDYLKPLNIITPKGRINTKLTKALDIEGLWTVGYGNWTGYASATLIGVGRTAQRTVKEIQEWLNDEV
ncbi:MAG: NAD(P)/FAD-dependent oxidoreductase [Aureispira sp.]|nr:NAD(P)/FAD-dependent oxidoreductase [Aureispira sp.]